MKNRMTDYEMFFMHLECTIENVGLNAINHQDQDKVHEESVKAVKSIITSLKDKPKMWIEGLKLQKY